jgi:excisionase family DNA binding protein
VTPLLNISREGSAEFRIGRSVSLEHAAQLLGVSRRTIYNRIREGRLRTIRTLGGSQRVLSESIAALRMQLEASGYAGTSESDPVEGSDSSVSANAEQCLAIGARCYRQTGGLDESRTEDGSATTHHLGQVTVSS